jgi:hypothetical protein
LEQEAQAQDSLTGVRQNQVPQDGRHSKGEDTMKFPKVLAAVAAMEKCQWKIGDALLDEIPMGIETQRNDTRTDLEECQEELEKQGLAISVETLRTYRLVASQFPPASRDAGCAWAVHRRAGSPEMLKAIQKVAGTKRIGYRQVEETKSVVEQHAAREYREGQRKAGVERKPTPKFKDKPTVRSEHLGGLRLMAEVLRHMGRLEDARDHIESTTTFVRENLTKLDKEETDLFIDLAFDIAKKGHTLADVAQRLADRRKKFLSVVGE